MRVVTKYLDNTVKVFTDSRGMTDSINGRRLTGHLLIHQIAKLFALTNPVSETILRDWLSSKGLDNDDISDLFGALELVVDVNGEEVCLKVESIDIQDSRIEYTEVFYKGYQRQMVPVKRTNPKIKLTLDADVTEQYVVDTIIGSVIGRVGNKITAVLYDNIKEKVFTYYGCFFTNMEVAEGVIEVDMVCDHSEQITV